MTPSPHPLSLDSVERIDAQCDDFEAAWTEGRAPRIEQYLDALPAEERAPTFSALLRVELELRRRAGEAVDVESYVARFPDLAAQVRSVLSERQAVVDTSVSLTSQTLAAAPETKPTQEAEEPLPATIGRFEVLQKIGAGAFGVVVRARDPQLDREVAIKYPRRGTLDKEFLRFTREAVAAANMHHPNICPVYEVGTADGRPYIVMSLVPGKSLAEHLRQAKEPMPIRQAVLTVRKLAQALALAHDKGIVHRDLKPANVMLDRERKDVVIMDFGLARVERRDDVGLTVSGMVLGTPAYMSPEQARGDQKAIGPATDIYSLGVILHELLTRQRPFEGSMAEVLGKILHVDAPGPAAVRPGVGPQLDAIVRKCMAKEPAERFRSMRELAEALTKHLKVRGAEKEVPAAETRSDDMFATVAAAPVSASPVLASPPRERGEFKTPVADAQGSPRGRIGVLLGFGFAAALILLGIMFFARTPTAEVYFHLKDVDPTDATLSFTLDKKPIAAADLIKPRELDVGAHEFVVNRGDKILHTYRFNVSKDAGPRIEFGETKTLQVIVDQPVRNPDRIAAEWVISQGGSVAFAEPGSNAEPTAQRLDQLPESFHVVVIDLWGRKLDDGSLRALKGIKHLKRIILFGCETVNDDGLKVLGAIPSLNGIAASGNPITDAGLLHLKALPNLESLGVGGNDITDQGLQTIAGFPRLQKLGLRRSQISATGISHLAALKSLNELGIDEMPVTADHVQAIAELAGLRTLHLGGPGIGGPRTGLAHLKTSPIRVLDLTNSDVNDDDLGGLEALAQLDELRLIGTRVTGGVGVPLPRLAELKTLLLDNTAFGDKGVADLAARKSLTTLSLVGTQVGDGSVEFLAKLKSLKKLDLTGSKITAEGLRRLRSELPDCRVVPESSEANVDRSVAEWVLVGGGTVRIAAEQEVPQMLPFPPQFIANATELPSSPFKVFEVVLTAEQSTDENLDRLAGLTHLRSLLAPGHGISDEGIAKIAQHRGLLNLELRGNRISPSATKELGRLADLQELFLFDTSIDDDALQDLAGLKRLTKLHIVRCAMTGTGATHLAQLPSLRRLSVGGPALSDEGLAALAQLDKLEFFGVDRGDNVTNAGLAHVGKMKNLRELFFGGEKANDEGVVQLANLKQLEVLNLRMPRMTRAGVRSLESLEALRDLALSGLGVNDDALESLAKLWRLKLLHLQDTAVTGAGLAHLEKLSQLEGLTIRDTPLSDEGLENLKPIPSLMNLLLSHTGLTDRGLEKLKVLRSVRHVHLEASPITTAGVAVLRKALPKAEVVWVEESGLSDRDRAVAEWVLRSGANVKVVIGEIPQTFDELAKVPVITDLAQLPVESFQVIGVQLHPHQGTDENIARLNGLQNLRFALLRGEGVTDKGVQLLAQHRHLRVLQLESKNITAAAGRELGQLTELEDLLLDNTGLNDDSLRELVLLKRLRVLSLDGAEVSGVGALHLQALPLVQLFVRGPALTDEGLRAISRLPNLTHLYFDSPGNVSDAGLAHLKELKSLQELVCGSPKITDDGAAHLADCGSLRELHLFTPKLSDEGIAHVGQIKDLRLLHFSTPLATAKGIEHLAALNLHDLLIQGTRVGDDALTHLGRMEQLQRIELHNTAVTGRDFGRLEKLRRLMVLRIMDSPIDDAGLAALKPLPELRELYLIRTKVTDEGLKQLHNIKSLKHVELHGSPVTQAGLAALQRALPECQIQPSPSTDPAAELIARLESMGAKITRDENAPDKPVAVVDFYDAKQKADDALLVELQHLPSLRRLVLWGCDKVTDDGLVALQKLPNLRELDLGVTRISDKGMEHLKPLADLEGLNLSYTQVTNNALAHIAGMKKLKSLALDSLPISDDGLQHVAGLTELTYLNLLNTKIEGPGLGHLAGMKKLKQLWLAKSPVNDDALQHFESLKELQQLFLGETRVTQGGVDRLQKALPECKIAFNDPARSAAEFLVANGAGIAGQTSDGQPIGDPKSVEQLPKKPFEIHYLEASKCQALTDEVLARHAAGLSHVMTINGNDTKFTGIGFAEWKQSKLTSLDLFNGSINDAGFKAICQLESIDFLSLEKNQAITDAGLVDLSKLRRLNLLGLNSTKITDEGLASIAKSPSLRLLHVADTGIGDEGLKHLAGTNLVSLNVHGTKVTSAGLAHLKNLNLEDIIASGTAVDDDGLQYFTGMTNFRRAYFNGTKIAGPGLVHLKALRLDELKLANTLVDDAAIGYLLEIKSLKSLDLTGTKVSPEGLKRVKEGLPECKVTP